MLDLRESITRYILSGNYFNKNTSRVNPRAFEPSKLDNTTSVFRISGLNDQEIWDIGSKNVAIPSQRTLHARVDFSVLTVISHGLAIRPSEPPPKHAEIFGWPIDKDAKMAIAQELAVHVSLIIKPDAPIK
jgi:hypothetical protein